MGAGELSPPYVLRILRQFGFADDEIETMLKQMHSHKLHKGGGGGKAKNGNVAGGGVNGKLVSMLREAGENNYWPSAGG